MPIDEWTLEWYDPPFRRWKNLYRNRRAWPLEKALTEMRREYEIWLKAVGMIPNVDCVIRLRNTQSNEVIPVAVVM